MANKLYNKQVTPKNYMGGGRVKKADGGKPESKYITRKPKKRKTGPYITRKNTTDKETVGDSQKRGKIDLGKLINRNRKMGGGMMNKRPMYNKGGRTKKMTEAQKEAAKKTGKKVMRFVKEIGNLGFPAGMAVDTGVKLAKRFKKMDGGSLKPVPAENKGLSKLPTKVRNKMGFMKKGGKVK